MLALGLHLEWWRVALIGCAVLFNQFSVGLSNDWIDADRDRAVGRTDKPVALGLVSVGLVRAAAFGCFAVSLLLTVPLGWLATIAQLIFIASAWAYNVALKKTWFSALPYVVGFGLLPMIVTLARPVPAFAAPWTLTLGAILGLAAHFANVLPDLDDDASTGVAGLPHRIGRRASGVIVVVVLAASGAVGFFAQPGPTSAIRVVNLALTLAVTATIAFVLRRPPTRLLFQLIIAAAVVNVVVLALAGQRLLA